MPKLPLGRLFWKFLIFFFLAQATAVLGIGLAIWASMPAHGTWAPAIPRAGVAEGGPAALAPPPLGADGKPLPPRGPGPGPKLPLVHLLSGALVSLAAPALR